MDYNGNQIGGDIPADLKTSTITAIDELGMLGLYRLPTTKPTTAKVILSTPNLGPSGEVLCDWADEVGAGDMLGAPSSVNAEVMLFGGTSGKQAVNSNLLISELATNPNISNSNDNVAPTYTFKKTRIGGAVQSGDRLGEILFKGNDGVATFTGARIESYALENATPGSNGSGLIIGTVSPGETNLSTRMTFTGDKILVSPLQGLSTLITEPVYGFIGRNSGLNNQLDDVLIIHNQVERLRVKVDGIDVKEKLSIVDEFDAKKWDYELEGDNLSLVNKDGVEFVKHVAGGLSIFRRNVKIEGDNVIIGNANVDTPRILFENTVSNPAFQIAVVEDNNTMEFLDENNDPVMVLTHNGADRDVKVAQDLLVGSVDLLDNNDPSAIIQANSTTKGFLMPRMTEVQRDAITPAEGLEIYNLTNKEVEYYNGTDWIRATQSGVDGPGVSTVNSFSLWNDTGGQTLKNSSMTYDRNQVFYNQGFPALSYQDYTIFKLGATINNGGSVYIPIYNPGATWPTFSGGDPNSFNWAGKYMRITGSGQVTTGGGTRTLNFRLSLFNRTNITFTHRIQNGLSLEHFNYELLLRINNVGQWDGYSRTSVVKSSDNAEIDVVEVSETIDYTSATNNALFEFAWTAGQEGTLFLRTCKITIE